jgi:uncharacterized membrane protein YdfJ with MMPL/SSD domain
VTFVGVMSSETGETHDTHSSATTCMVLREIAQDTSHAPAIFMTASLTAAHMLPSNHSANSALAGRAMRGALAQGFCFATA